MLIRSVILATTWRHDVIRRSVEIADAPPQHLHAVSAGAPDLELRPVEGHELEEDIQRRVRTYI